MKTLIIEDEKAALRNLKAVINEVSAGLEIIGETDSIVDTIEWFQTHPMPELVFMDIHLADGSSFGIFEKVQIKSPVIFTTAYDEYALKAFEVNSIDYLLKPINVRNFERAISKYRNLVLAKDTNVDAISNLLATFNKTKDTWKSHFLIPYKDKLIPLAIDRIACFYVENKMAKIITTDDVIYYLDSPLEDLYAQLDPSEFFRANRQYIISHKAIKDISIWFGSKLSVNLIVAVPEKIIVSKARVADFKAWYTK